LANIAMSPRRAATATGRREDDIKVVLATAR